MAVTVFTGPGSRQDSLPFRPLQERHLSKHSAFSFVAGAGAGVPSMTTVHDRIGQADRQIERMRLRIEQQRTHADNLRWDRFEPEAEKARALLDRMVGELALLQQYRLSLYQQASFADVPKKAS